MRALVLVAIHHRPVELRAPHTLLLLLVQKLPFLRLLLEIRRSQQPALDFPKKKPHEGELGIFHVNKFDQPNIEISFYRFHSSIRKVNFPKNPHTVEINSVGMELEN